MERAQQWPSYDLVRDVGAIKRTLKQMSVNSRGSAWYSYDIVWTSTGTQPVFNDAIVVSRYQRIGRTCIVRIDMTFQAGTTYGTGNYSWTVPFVSPGFMGAIGYFNLFTSGGTRVGGQAVLPNGSSTFTAVVPTSGSPHTLTAVSNAIPVTFASGDRIRMGIEYEVAEGS